MKKKKRVYIAYTGGTIGMRRGEHGYRPAPGFLAEQMAAMPEFQHPAMPDYEIGEGEPLLDSSNMTPADWVRIGDELIERYDDYDGFVVLHGTDTMAYTASALSFMFENLGKPIVLTGSQVPLMEVRNDARENLIASLLIAAYHAIPEVCLFFGDRLLRGNRVTKVSAVDFRAFHSPNSPALGVSGVKLDISWDLVVDRPTGPVRFHRPSAHPHVADVRIFPGMMAATLRRFLRRPLQGAVLHTYGMGNAPNRPAFRQVVHDAAERGTVLVNCTQCLEGTVDMDGYATGRALRDAGVISGYDMTPEAALTKLYVLLARGLEIAEVKRLMQEDLRGELTRPNERDA